MLLVPTSVAIFAMSSPYLRQHSSHSVPACHSNIQLRLYPAALSIPLKAFKTQLSLGQGPLIGCGLFRCCILYRGGIFIDSCVHRHAIAS